MNNFRSIETDRLALKVLGADDWREVLDFLNDGKEVFEKYQQTSLKEFPLASRL